MGGYVGSMHLPELFASVFGMFFSFDSVCTYLKMGSNMHAASVNATNELLYATHGSSHVYGSLGFYDDNKRSRIQEKESQSGAKTKLIRERRSFGNPFFLTR
jgi:hypothetical protein